ncbi:MAG TPA: dipeptide/oligopeptide/nickel ABC transporter permease/ATP-binding protein [Conexibacter sp.]|nr:dipeptide/oligopeptide/nickel ABC transporter permease/ATP-binding protein [Conexibacter sp.]
MSSGVVVVAELESGSAPEATEAPRFLRRLLRRPLAVGCMAFLTLVLLAAIFAPILWPDVATQQAGELLHVHEGPSAAHPLGTDTLGRDVLERLLVGTRVTVVAVFEALLVNLLVGVPLGLAAGYLGGRVDQIATWLIDFAFSIPSLIIVLVVLAVFPHSTLAAMIAVGLLFAPQTARIVRAATMPVREELYIAAARVSGLSRPYIVSRHVLPRIAGVVIVQASLFAATVVVAQAGLAFLGVLGDPPAPSWGEMITDGIAVLQLQPWLIWPPGIAIALTVLALSLLGDAVRDATAEGWSSASRRRRRPAATAPAPQRELAEPVVGHAEALLAVEGLGVVFDSPGGPVPVVEDLTLQVRPGEAVGLLGESGCGKTMSAMAILGLLPGIARISSGSIGYGGRDLVSLSERELSKVRGKEIALISQEPMVSLTPTLRVGWQIAEAVRRHRGVSKQEARERAIELLRQVHLPEPELVARRYLHELSGGMAQRVAIARALAGEPKLVIADEPTTALDVTVQAEILDLLRELQRERGMAILLITHDWGVIADICDRAVVMYAGQLVEQAGLEPIFERPRHPYTQALLASNPHHAVEGEPLPTIPGAVPRPGDWPAGCHFHPRCAYATDACRDGRIPVVSLPAGRETRCIHHEQMENGR